MTENLDDDVGAALERVAAARGHAEDADWAFLAIGRMLMDDVLETRVVEALDELAAQIAHSGESPEDLFGSPFDWAREQRAAWRERGATHTAPPRMVARDLVGETLIIASLFSGVFLLYALLPRSSGDPMTLSWLVVPLALAVAGRAMVAVFESVRSARSYAQAVIAAALTIAVGMSITVGVAIIGSPISLGTSARLGMLGATVGYALLAFILLWWWPEPREKPAEAEPSGDDEWLAALASALRTRGDMTDARVARIVGDTRDHAHDAGRSLTEEFGAPRACAKQFPPDPLVPRRRKAWFYTLVAVLILIANIAGLIEGTASWWHALWLLLIVVIAAQEWRAATSRVEL